MIKPVLLVVLLLVSAAEAKELYRYRDSAGVLVTADTIPPLAAAGGYEIVNGQGRVLQVIVAQAPSINSLDQDKQDQYLLASFSRVSEIAKLKQRKLALLARDIDNLANNLASLMVREFRLTAEGANMEMAGEEVSLDLLARIGQTRAERAELEQRLADRRRDRARIGALYDGYQQRFRQLLDIERTTTETSEQ
jgi:hypothetical protein